MDIGQALKGLIRQAHEQGGRPVGSPNVPNDAQERVTIAAVWYGHDGVYVRVYRQGQTVATRPIPWRGSVAPVVNAKATLVKPMGNLNIGWVLPATVAPS